MNNAMNRRKFLGTSTAVAGLITGSGPLFAAGAKNESGSGPIVNTTSGKLRGSAQGKVKAFKGIPYGAATNGNGDGAGRFMPPAKVQPWTGVRDALELGPPSPQNSSNLIPESLVARQKADDAGTEDCLHLNVWSQSTNAGKRPIMVWFHGGGYSGGSANWAMYDGTNLAAKHDVVVVTVNHRLNVFGYLYLADLGGAQYAQSSNVGMLDCIQALEWVRDNAASFGGDPNNVTIFGQSGGGGKVSTLMGMPGAKGLFHRAIAMSGSNVNGTTRDRANQGVEAFLKTLGLDKNGIDKLQTLPIPQLLKAMADTRGLNLSPVIDGRTMPAGPFNPVASDFSANVPLMIGSTETEITWSNFIKLDPLDAAGLHARVKEYAKTDDAATDRLIAAYRKGWPKADNLSLALVLGTDVSNFRTGTDTEAERKAILSQSAAKAPVYKYYFQWYSPVRGGALRAYHTLDIPFVFLNTAVTPSMNGDNVKELQPLSEKMSAAFVAFARSGNPNTKITPKWESFNMTDRGMMIFNNECRFANDPFKEQRLARIAENAAGAPA